jgi:hypothetical protein
MVGSVGGNKWLVEATPVASSAVSAASSQFRFCYSGMVPLSLFFDTLLALNCQIL